MAMASIGPLRGPHLGPFANTLRLLPHLLLLPPRNRTNRTGLCHAAVLSRDDKNELLRGVDKSHVEDVARVLELARRAADRWEVAHSDFLTPPVLGDSLAAIRKLSDVGALVSGGYGQAERCRLSVGHVESIEAGSIEGGDAGFPGAIAALSVSGNFAFDTAAHGDFLGAILGTGITREKVGDIIVQGEKGAQILVVPEVVEFFQSSLVQVRNVQVQTTAIPLTDLQLKPQRVDTFRSVEASLRVDALASAGFHISRSKLVALISGGDVKVNWKEVTKNGLSLKTGDVVSVRGKGRLEDGICHVLLPHWLGPFGFPRGYHVPALKVFNQIALYGILSGSFRGLVHGYSFLYDFDVSTGGSDYHDKERKICSGAHTVSVICFEHSNSRVHQYQ